EVGPGRRRSLDHRDAAFLRLSPVVLQADFEGSFPHGNQKHGQDLFGLNSRYVDDARLKAQGMIDAQKELLELEIETTEAKLRLARKKLGWARETRSRAE
ncbi:hypothetical protein AB1398_05370, partial [Hydrogenibacillus schlegelii]